jgi:rod shape-determining protein MreD
MTPAHHERGGSIIFASFAVALLLEILPLPDVAEAWRPAWVMMVIIYWSLALPFRVGVFAAWSAGLLHDILSDSLMGEHALIYALLAYFILLSGRQIRVFPIWQQSLIVFALVIGGKLIGVWIESMTGQLTMRSDFLYPAVSSMLLWYWVFVLLCDLRRRFRISDES